MSPRSAGSAYSRKWSAMASSTPQVAGSRRATGSTFIAQICYRRSRIDRWSKVRRRHHLGISAQLVSSPDKANNYATAEGSEASYPQTKSPLLGIICKRDERKRESWGLGLSPMTDSTGLPLLTDIFRPSQLSAVAIAAIQRVCEQPKLLLAERPLPQTRSSLGGIGLARHPP